MFTLLTLWRSRCHPSHTTKAGWWLIQAPDFFGHFWNGKHLWALNWVFFFWPLFVVFVICPLSFSSLDESGLRRWFKVVSVGDWFGFRSLSEAGVRAQTLVIHSQSRRAAVTLPFPLVWVRSEVTCAIVLWNGPSRRSPQPVQLLVVWLWGQRWTWSQQIIFQVQEMISVAKSFKGRAIKCYFYPDSVRNFTVQRLKCNIYI